MAKKIFNFLSFWDSVYPETFVEAGSMMQVCRQANGKEGDCQDAVLEVGQIVGVASRWNKEIGKMEYRWVSELSDEDKLGLKKDLDAFDSLPEIKYVAQKPSEEAAPETLSAPGRDEKPKDRVSYQMTLQ